MDTRKFGRFDRIDGSEVWDKGFQRIANGPTPQMNYPPRKKSVPKKMCHPPLAIPVGPLPVQVPSLVSCAPPQHPSRQHPAGQGDLPAPLSTYPHRYLHLWIHIPQGIYPLRYLFPEVSIKACCIRTELLKLLNLLKKARGRYRSKAWVPPMLVTPILTEHIQSTIQCFQQCKSHDTACTDPT